MITLKSIAKISAGHPFRGKLNEVAGGSAHVLQMKDIDDSFFINSTAATKINQSDIKPQYLLKTGDIVFRSRGHTNTAAATPIVTPIPNAATRVATPVIRARAPKNSAIKAKSPNTYGMP
ncbi:MAG: hypothetical protein V3V05_00540, partial [Pontiella sp.]